MKIQTSTKESVDFKKPHIEEGIYVAELKEVKEVSEGQYGPRLAFIYKVEDAELAYICYNVSNATKDNKLGKAIEAHGVEIKDQEVELDSLVGTKAKAWVEDYEYEADEDGKKVKKTGSSIAKLKPITEKVK